MGFKITFPQLFKAVLLYCNYLVFDDSALMYNQRGLSPQGAVITLCSSGVSLSLHRAIKAFLPSFVTPMC